MKICLIIFWQIFVIQTTVQWEEKWPWSAFENVLYLSIVGVAASNLQYMSSNKQCHYQVPNWKIDRYFKREYIHSNVLLANSFHNWFFIKDYILWNYFSIIIWILFLSLIVALNFGWMKICLKNSWYWTTNPESSLLSTLFYLLMFRCVISWILLVTQSWLKQSQNSSSIKPCQNSPIPP